MTSTAPSGLAADAQAPISVRPSMPGNVIASVGSAASGLTVTFGGGGGGADVSLAASLAVGATPDVSPSHAARNDDADAALKPKSTSRRKASRRGMRPST